MLHHVVLHADSDFDTIEMLRLIRNATAAGYVNDHSQISVEAQLEWWKKMRFSVWGKVWEAVDDNGVSEPVGFMLVRADDTGRYWSTGGVVPKYTGHGHGRQFLNDVIRSTQVLVTGLGRADNVAAMKLHDKKYWREVPWTAQNVHAYATHPTLREAICRGEDESELTQHALTLYRNK